MSDIALEQASPTVETPKVEEVPMMDVTVQEVYLMEDSVRVVLGNEKSRIEKVVSWDSFKDIIATVIGRQEDEKLDGFQLPSNCFYFAKSSSTIQISCYYAERNADIKYIDRKMTIKVPNMIISHTLTRAGKEWKINSTKFFATDSSVARLPKKFINQIDYANRIFLSPLPNTYAEGNMCYGGNTMIYVFRDNNLRGLDWYYQFLFDSPFNNDLGVRSLNNDSGDVRAWFTTLAKVAKDNTPFPYSSLRGFTANS